MERQTKVLTTLLWMMVITTVVGTIALLLVGYPAGAAAAAGSGTILIALLAIAPRLRISHPAPGKVQRNAQVMIAVAVIFLLTAVVMAVLAVEALWVGTFLIAGVGILIGNLSVLKVAGHEDGAHTDA